MGNPKSEFDKELSGLGFRTVDNRWGDDISGWTGEDLNKWLDEVTGDDEELRESLRIELDKLTDNEETTTS